MGSIGCKIASIVGETVISIYVLVFLIKALQSWDFAAPGAILKSSGGAITNLYNQSLFTENVISNRWSNSRIK